MIEKIKKILEEIGESPEMGCIILYIGRVKGKVRGKRVKLFRIKEISGSLKDIEEEIKSRYNLEGISIHHREGELKPGEDILIIGIGARTREDALSGVREAIERIKALHEEKKEEEYE